MKDEREKKKTRSIKVSDNQYDLIKQKADEKHMSFSEYVVNCAVHGNQSFTPQMAVKIQTIMNLALDLAERLDYNESHTAQQLQRQVQDLDELFHPLSPEQQVEKMKNDIDNMIKEGYGLWESLK